METVVVVAALGASNAITVVVCMQLFGRVRHLEGLIEGMTKTAPTTSAA